MKRKADVTFHPAWWNQYAGIEFDEKFFFDAEYRVQADVKMRRTLYDYFGEYGLGEADPKPRPILFSDLIACGFLYSQILGCQVIYTKDNAPVVCTAEIAEEQIDTLTVPDLDHCELWKKVEEQIAYFEEKYGYVESAVNLMGIQNIALDLRGEELFVDYYTEPELANKLLRTITDLSVEIGKRLYSVSNVISGGVTSIVKQVIPEVYLTSNCSVTMISNQMYCDFLLKYDSCLAENFTNFGIHHCGNNLENVIEGYLKVPNLKFIEVGAGSNLQVIADCLRKNNREDIILCIRYSPVKLRTENAEYIRKETEEAVRIFGTDEKLCFSCVGIDTSVEMNKVREYLSVFRNQ